MKLLLLFPLLLSSCVYADKDRYASLGGKGAYAGRDFSVTNDHEKSFDSAAVLAGVGISAVQSLKSIQATEATNRVINTNATNQAINATNKAAETTQAGFKSASEVQKFVPK